jgi:lipoyl synthase
MPMDSLRAPSRVLKKVELRNLAEVQRLVKKGRLHTVCEEARCPNIGECWSRPTATFMILGSVCTRGCRFCSVSSGRPMPVDAREPEHLAATAAEMDLRHVVITSVNRDELPDGGAAHFAACIRAVRKRLPTCRIEVLTPDFKNKPGAVDIVAEAAPDVFNHNLETVPRLYRGVRPGAVYAESLALLRRAKELGLPLTKTGLMVGLGESKEEVFALMDDARAHQVDILTIGQYLRPSRDSLPVVAYIEEELFEEYRREGLRRGFKMVAAGTHVRSSYLADQVFDAASEAPLPDGRAFGQ